MAGLYLHIPFCLKKCGYCDFYSSGIRDRGRAGMAIDQIACFLSAIEKEWDLYAGSGFRSIGFFETVYFGGGTPSLLKPEQIRRLINRIRPFLSHPAITETTLEANPATIAPDKLKAYLDAGINRISIGVQSFDDGILKLLGRLHSAMEAEEAILMAREAGFDNIGLDLIFAVPRQTLSGWKRTVEKAISLAPDHVSAYSLTWSGSTPLGRQIESGRIARPGDDETADMSLLAAGLLQNAGYEQYEISNYAKSGKRSRHNESYWTGIPYLGLGPSAHSFTGTERFWNVSDTERYIQTLGQGLLPVAAEETLSPEDRRLERLSLGLRTKEGVSMSELEIDASRLAPLADAGLARSDGGRLCLTPKGMLLADEIALKLA